MKRRRTRRARSIRCRGFYGAKICKIIFVPCRPRKRRRSTQRCAATHAARSARRSATGFPKKRSRCAPPPCSPRGRTAGSLSPSTSRHQLNDSEEAARLAHHFLTQPGKRRPAVAQELVVKVVPQRLFVGRRRRRTCACVLGDPVGAQFPNHEFSQRVIQVRGIKGASRSLLARIARILKRLLPEHLL